MKKKQYQFLDIQHCNMCHSRNFRVKGIRMNQSQGKSPKSKTGIIVTVAECKECNLLFSSPQPIPPSINDHYGIEPNAYWPEDYFQLSPHHFSHEIRKIQQLLPFNESQCVLDIGAGLGKTMKSFQSKGYKVHGIEPSETFYKMAIERSNISASNLDNLSIENANFEENKFDVISFGAVLEHLYDPNLSLNKAIKWLKPGGILHAEIPHSKWLVSSLFNLYYRLIGTNFVTNLSPMHPPFHLYEFTKKSFELNGKKNGYKIAEIEFFPGEIPSMRKFNFILNPLMKLLNKELVLVVYLRKL